MPTDGRSLHRQSSQEVQIENETHACGVKIKEGGDAFDLLHHIFFGQKFLAGGTLGVVAAGTVDKDVANTQLSLDDLVGFLETFQFQNIGRKTDGFAAFGIDFFCDLFGIRSLLQSSPITIRTAAKAWSAV